MSVEQMRFEGPFYEEGVVILEDKEDLDSDDLDSIAMYYAMLEE